MIRHVHRTQRGIGRIYDCPNGCRLGIETRETTAELEELARQRPERPTEWVLIVLMVVVLLLALVGLVVVAFESDQCSDDGGKMVRTLFGVECVQLMRKERP